MTQDPDVLDVWFSSALWAFSPLGWGNNGQMNGTFNESDLKILSKFTTYYWI